MKHINGNTQMTDVWRLPAIAPWEKNVYQTPYTKAVGFVKPHYFGFYTSRGVGTRSVCRFVNNRHCSQPPWPKVLGYRERGRICCH